MLAQLKGTYTALSSHWKPYRFRMVSHWSCQLKFLFDGRAIPPSCFTSNAFVSKENKFFFFFFFFFQLERTGSRWNMAPNWSAVANEHTCLQLMSGMAKHYVLHDGNKTKQIKRQPYSWDSLSWKSLMSNFRLRYNWDRHESIDNHFFLHYFLLLCESLTTANNCDKSIDT